MFYLYFDKNGVLQECVQEEGLRVGSSNINGLAVYCELFDDEDLELNDIWYLQEKPDGTRLNEISFIDNILESTIPYDKEKDYKYFKDYKTYKFYYVEFDSNNLDTEGLQLATVRLNFGDTLKALGEITFNVENNIIKTDNNITQSQYDYLITIFKARTKYIESLKTKVNVNGDNVEVSGNIIPTGTYDLGSDTNRWNNLNVCTIYLNGKSVSETFNEINTKLNEVDTKIDSVNTNLQYQIDNIETKITPYTGSENITIENKVVSLNKDLQNIDSINNTDTGIEIKSTNSDTRYGKITLEASGEESNASISIQGSVSGKGTVNIEGDLTAQNDVEVQGLLEVKGDTYLRWLETESDIIAKGDLETDSNLLVSGDISVDNKIKTSSEKTEIIHDNNTVSIDSTSITANVVSGSEIKSSVKLNSSGVNISGNTINLNGTIPNANINRADIANLKVDTIKPLENQVNITNGSASIVLDNSGTVNINGSSSSPAFNVSIDGTSLYGVILDTIQKGVAGGVATLDSTGKVPSSQLPSYVDDVLEYSSKSQFPTTGESGKIYIATDTNLTYRWSGSTYVEISQSLALGETSSTAYPGDKGKTATETANSALSKANTNESNIAKLETSTNTLKTTVDTNTSDIANLSTSVSTLQTSISTLSTTANSALSKANSANTTANSALSKATTNESNITKKQDKLTAGSNITIENNVISAAGTSDAVLKNPTSTPQEINGSIVINAASHAYNEGVRVNGINGIGNFVISKESGNNNNILALVAENSFKNKELVVVNDGTRYDIFIPNANGTLALTNQIPTVANYYTVLYVWDSSSPGDWDIYIGIFAPNSKVWDFSGEEGLADFCADLAGYRMPAFGSTNNNYPINYIMPYYSDEEDYGFFVYYTINGVIKSEKVKLYGDSISRDTW